MLGGESAAAALVAAAASATASPAAWKAALHAAFSTFMNQPEATVTAQTTALASRLQGLGLLSSSSVGDSGTPRSLSADATAARLLHQFPGDVGVFAPYLLNVRNSSR